MCGLVGIAGNMEFRDESTFRRLLVFDVFRGMDSTGVAFFDKKGHDCDIVKIKSHPIDLFDLKRYTKAENSYSSSVFLGHNRAATVGQVNTVNAHPFEYGHIVGAHNGTLDKSSWQDLNEANEFDCDVDSQAVFLSISQRGIEETIKMMCGAWALTYIDKDERTLNFIKNDKRPLWYAFTEDMKKIIWASEYPMIQAAIGMSSDKYIMNEDKDGYVYFPFENDHLYTIQIDELMNGEFDISKFKGKKIEGKEPLPVVTYNQGGSPFHFKPDGTKKTWNQTTYGSSGGNEGTKTSKKGNKNREVTTIFLDGDEYNPFGGAVSYSREQHITAVGCTWCQGEVDLTKPGVITYERGGEVLCHECSGSEYNRVFVEDIHELDSLRQVVCN